MLIVIPVCHKDVEICLQNLEWIAKLDPMPYPYTAAVSHDSGFDATKVIELAKQRFANVIECRYPPWRGQPQAWPGPQNWAWQETARWVEACPKENWLWWEQDAVPVRSGWLKDIVTEYRKANKPFMGHIVENFDGHMNGVGCYPYNLSKYATDAFLCRAAPFDVVLRSSIRNDNTHNANHLFQHVIRPDGQPCIFFSERDVELTVAKSTALFHRCKDGSLIDIMSGGEFKRVVPIKRKPATDSSGVILPITAHLDVCSGYGTYSCEIIKGFIKRKYNVELRTPSMWNEYGGPPQELKQRIKNNPITTGGEFVIYPCVFQPASMSIGNHRIAWLTMWETTRLMSTANPKFTKALEVLNKCVVAMVPNAWNASVFSSCGVDTPIRVTPLGTDTSVFKWVPNKPDEVFTFGTAARFLSGGIRKGGPLCVDAFRRAFPNEKDVRLRVKGFADDPHPETGNDPRIEILNTYLSLPDIVKWYESINVFVSGSAAEGWGRHQQEAMCVGRPVIGINFGGVCEFFNEENGYAVDWKLDPAEGIYTSMGHYAKPKIDSMVEQMRRAYENRKEMHRKSILSYNSAKRFTIENSVDKIREVLVEFEIISG